MQFTVAMLSVWIENSLPCPGRQCFLPCLLLSRMSLQRKIDWRWALLAGGQGLGVFDGCLIAEELAYGCSGIMAAVTITNIGVSINGLFSCLHRWHEPGYFRWLFDCRGACLWLHWHQNRDRGQRPGSESQHLALMHKIWLTMALIHFLSDSKHQSFWLETRSSKRSTLVVSSMNLWLQYVTFIILESYIIIYAALIIKINYFSNNVETV